MGMLVKASEIMHDDTLGQFCSETSHEWTMHEAKLLELLNNEEALNEKAFVADNDYLLDQYNLRLRSIQTRRYSIKAFSIKAMAQNYSTNTCLQEVEKLSNRRD